jgi:1,4-dihydroxy-2-naphthoate octaprenyltransferase
MRVERSCSLGWKHPVTELADPVARRQLRFAVFLQAMALLMMGGAAVLRAVKIGFDPLTIVLGVLAILIAVALAFTTRQLRRTGILPT